MSERKSICQGISSLATMGANMASEVAGVPILSVPAVEDFTWDDTEEKMYRDWVKEKVAEKEDAEWNEFQQEETYREKMKEAGGGGEEVNWEDQKEREYRQMWINMRLEGQGRVEWDDAAEREAREMERKRSEARKKKPIVISKLKLQVDNKYKIKFQMVNTSQRQITAILGMTKLTVIQCLKMQEQMKKNPTDTNK